jgi:hypothetical protein
MRLTPPPPPPPPPTPLHSSFSLTDDHVSFSFFFEAATAS